MTTPKLGLGTQYWVETSAGSAVFQRLAKILDVKPPAPDKAEEDITNMDSEAEETMPSLANYGMTSLPMLYEEDSDTDAFILAWIEDGSTRRNRIVYKSGAMDEWSGWAKTYEPELPVKGVCKATLSVRNTGKPTRTPA